MTEQESAPRAAQTAASQEQEAGLWARLPPWLNLRRIPMPILVGAVVLLALLIGVAISSLPFLLGIDEDDLENLGYPGVFVANLLGTATLFFPVPGLTAAGQTLLVAAAQRLNPFAVALLGGTGMALAEITAYVAGRGLRELSAERQMPIRGRLGQWLAKAASLVDRLMLRYGFVTLLVLAGVPNPVFEFAGITAGAVRMRFWRFMLAVGSGKMMRAFLLAFVGDVLLNLFRLE